MNCFGLGVSLRANLSIATYLRIGLGKRANVTAHRVSSSKIQDARDSDRWFSPEEVERMSRRSLQKLCKKLSIRANSKTTQLKTDLLDFHRDILSSSPILKYPFVPVQMPAKYASVLTTPSSPRQEKGLFVYRNTDVIQPSFLTDTNAGVIQGVRHYNKGTRESDETEDIHQNNTNMCADRQDRPLPSVSAILRATAPKSKLFAISHWTRKQKQLLGEEVFRQRMNEAKKNGSEFHSFVHRCLVDRSLNTKGPVRLQGFLESTKQVFDRLGDAVASEHKISHVHLGYRGRIDTLACYDGDPCVIEWKTSKRKKPYLEDCGDYPLQVVAYAGAVNSEALFGFQVKHGLIVIAYEDGSLADVHQMDLRLCRSIWQDWLMRVYKFYNQDIKEKVAP